ncbi:MAG: hypothetical protein M3H12_07790 [Chromatiales bacterium]|nr:hypothetical protein [Gammaproteobacteria bacterium]
METEYQKLLLVFRIGNADRVTEIATSAAKALKLFCRNIQPAFTSKHGETFGLLLDTEEPPHIVIATLFRKAGLSNDDFVIATELTHAEARGNNIVESWLNI